jgi:hypothetical protein
MTTRVSLAELAAADIHLRPAEAVTLVSDICRQYLEGTLRGVPSPGVLRISRDGEVLAEGPVTTGQNAVFRAARLLDELLGGFDAAPEFRASGGLRLVIARGLGTLDLPPYRSLEEFRDALQRFASLDVQETVRDLFRDWIRTRMQREPFVDAPLTISDVRRARRATGLSLQDIADVAGVPAARLRDLEWGDVRRWRSDAEGRTQVIRYARAAGLDEKVVLSIAWPLIEETSLADGAEAPPMTALVPSGPQRLVPVAQPSPHRRPRAYSHRWVTAAAVLMLVILAAFALAWKPVTGGGTPRREPAPIAAAEPSTPPATPLVAAAGVPRPARKARPAPAKSASAKRPQQGRTSLFQKELFRIEIR